MDIKSAALRTLFDVYVNSVVGAYVVPKKVRGLFLSPTGIKASGASIAAQVHITGRDVSIGKNTFVNYGCYIEASAPVTIGSKCSIGPQSMIMTATHAIAGPKGRAGQENHQAIRIGDGVWLGARVLVMPGVVIEDGVVVGAGSIVTSRCEANGLYVGSPARRVRDL